MNRRKQIYLGLFSILVGFSLLAVIVHRLSLSAILDQFHEYDWRYFAAAIPLGFSATAGRVVRYCLFFAAKGRPVLLYILFVYMRGLIYVLPFRSGELASLYLLKRWGFVSSMSSAAPGWTIIRLGDVLARLLFLVPALAFLMPLEPRSAAWFVYIFIAICLIVIFLGTWKHLSDALVPILGRYTGRLIIIFREFQLGLVNTKSRWRIAGSVIMAIFIAALNVFVSVCALWALSLPVSLPTAVAIVVISQSLGALPFRPPLGIGLQESIWTGLLIVAGLDVDQAFAGALSVRVVQMSIIAIETAVAAVANLFCSESD